MNSRKRPWGRLLLGAALGACITSPAAEASLKYEQTFVLHNGDSIPIYSWYDPSAEPRAVMIGIHGSVRHGRVFAPLARELAPGGMIFYAVDLRGHGRWAEVSKSISRKGRREFYQSDDASPVSPRLSALSARDLLHARSGDLNQPVNGTCSGHTAGQPAAPALGTCSGHTAGQPAAPALGTCSGHTAGQPAAPALGTCSGHTAGQPAAPALGTCSGHTAGQPAAPAPGTCSGHTAGQPAAPAPGTCRAHTAGQPAAPAPGTCSAHIAGDVALLPPGINRLPQTASGGESEHHTGMLALRVSQDQQLVIGSGRQPVDYEASSNDLAQVIELLRQRHPGLPVFCIGESVGAAVSLRTAAEYPRLIDGLVLASPGTEPVLHGLKSTLGYVLQGMKTVGRSIDLSRHFQKISHDPRSCEEVLNDPLTRRRTSVRDLLHTARFIKKSPRFAQAIDPALPVLLLQGTRDAVVTARSTTSLFHHFKGTGNQLKLLHERGHTLVTTRYLDKEVIAYLREWIHTHAPEAGMRVASANGHPL